MSTPSTDKDKDKPKQVESTPIGGNPGNFFDNHPGGNPPPGGKQSSPSLPTKVEEPKKEIKK